MSLILKMQINDQSENKYIFSTENGEIELIPLSVVANGEYVPEEGQGFSTVTVSVPQTVLEQLNITENGRYEASSGHGYDVVTVNVQPILDILVDTVNENGTYVYEPEEGYDGLEEVRVTVSVPEPVFEHLTRTITSNGTYNYTPSSGKDGFDEANITVNVPTPQPSLEQKTEYYNANGNYTVQPSQGYDGISEVAVEVDVQLPPPTAGPLELTGQGKITQNGTFMFNPVTFMYDYFDFAEIEVDVSGGGGVSNVFETEFTLQDQSQVAIPLTYTGNGYPIMVAIFPAENYKNSNLQSLVRGGSVIYALAFKNKIEDAPSYSNNSNTDQFVKLVGFKSGQNQSVSASVGELSYMCVPASHTISPSSQYNTFYLTPTSLILVGQTTTSGSHYGFPAGFKFKAVVLFSE